MEWRGNLSSRLQSRGLKYNVDWREIRPFFHSQVAKITVHGHNFYLSFMTFSKKIIHYGENKLQLKLI